MPGGGYITLKGVAQPSWKLNAAMLSDGKELILSFHDEEAIDREGLWKISSVHSLSRVQFGRHPLTSMCISLGRLVSTHVCTSIGGP